MYEIKFKFEDISNLVFNIAYEKGYFDKKK